jgi:hypothetical protein
MGEADLWDLDAGTRTGLELLPGVPVGGVRCGDGHPEHPRRPLAGVLRLAGSPQLAARYPVALPPGLVDRSARDLRQAYQQNRRVDKYWVTVTGGEPDGAGPIVGLFTREQALAQRDLLADAEATEVVLPNGQVLPTTTPAAGSTWLDRAATLELQRIRYREGAEGLVADGDQLFQAVPSGPYVRRLSSSHSFRCLLSPAHRPRFPGGFALVRNPILEQIYPEADLALAVLVGFAKGVAPHAVVVDETVATGIGLRPGEIVEVSALPKFSTGLAQRALSFRHALCRVHGSNTTDMEKPLVRLPEEVLDIVGVDSGARVVVEAFGYDSRGSAGRRRIVVRALPWRGDQWPAPRPGVPDILMETGSQDLPPVTLDLACQQELDAPRGSVVYVRPAVGSLLVDEWSTAATAVVVASLSAAVLGSVLLSTLFILLFVTLLCLQVWRRLR